MIWKHAARAGALLSAPLCLLGFVTVASASADHIVVSHIVGPNVVLGEFESRAKPIVKHVEVLYDTKTFLAAFAVIDDNNCIELDPGRWTVVTKPNEGGFATGTVKGQPNSGPCKSYTFNYAAIYYTWRAKTGSKDSGSATWKGTICIKPSECIRPYEFIFHLVK